MVPSGSGIVWRGVCRLRDSGMAQQRAHPGRAEELTKRVIESLGAAPGRKELLITFVAAVISTPFLTLVAIFVPLLGQILGVLAGIVTLGYLRKRGHWSPAIAFFAGVCCFWGVMYLSVDELRGRTSIALYLMMGLGVPYAFAYLFLVGGLLWGLSDQGLRLSSEGIQGEKLK